VSKHTVTRSCGHVETVALIGKIKDREWRLDNVESQKLCSECWQAELAKQREEQNREAAEAAKDNGLPALIGTEKQIPWAESIRQQMLADIDTFIYKQIRIEHRNNPDLFKAVEKIRAKTEARWWIDHRGMDMSYEIKHLLEEAAKEAKVEQIQLPKEVIADALAEATVRPENPVTETVAEIRAMEDSIEISFPERRDDFRELVKKKLKMEWDGKWIRKLVKRNGTPQDRAAEAGHRLLAAGFVVRIFNENIRARAIASDYEPEHTRWIMTRKEEAKYGGWFAIRWDRDDDFYKAAKKLPGARWSSPHVVVPTANFEEVIDFAKMYGFKVSDSAQETAEQARRIKDIALTVRIEVPTEPEKMIVSGHPPMLEVPTEVGVADEFRD